MTVTYFHSWSQHPSSTASAAGLIPNADLLLMVGRLLLGENHLPSIALLIKLLLFHHSLLAQHPECRCCFIPQLPEGGLSLSPKVLPNPAMKNGGS